MRCPNCGWMNPTGQTQCEKCQTAFSKDGGTPPPSAPPVAPLSPPRPAAPPPAGGGVPFAAGTVMGKQANLPAWDEAMSPTPKVPSSAPVPPAAAVPGAPPREARPTVDQGRKQAQGNDMNECPNASCGYPNSSKSKFCVACGTPLKGSSSAMAGDRPTERGEPLAKVPSPPGSTKRQMMPEDDDDAVMPAPMSKPKPQRQAAAPNVNATVNPWSKKKEATFTLRPVMREGENPRPDVQFEGESVEVNRNTLDPSNTTITGKVQAVFEYRDGAWFLTNKSALQTTFVRVDAPVQLKKGDIVLMGDRLFEFDE